MRRRGNKKVGAAPTSTLKDVSVRYLEPCPETGPRAPGSGPSGHGLATFSAHGSGTRKIKNRPFVWAVSILRILSLIVVGGGYRLAPKPLYACC